MTTSMRIQLLQTAINALKQLEEDKKQFASNPAYIKMRIELYIAQYSDCLAQLLSEGLTVAMMGSLSKDECHRLTYMELIEQVLSN